MTWVMATMLNAQAHLDSAQSSFEFVFMTDIHIRPDMNAPKGFQMAIDAVNQLNPDFVLTGYSGDMHPVIPAICTHLLNYQFDKVILFFLNCLLLTRFYALCELPCL